MEEDKRQFVEAFKQRTKVFAIRIIKMYRAISKTEEGRIIGKQILRSGTSVAANYRAVNRARSQAEYIAKLGIVVEEADETLFWLELLEESGIIEVNLLSSIKQEAEEILKILSAAKSKSSKSLQKPKTSSTH